MGWMEIAGTLLGGGVVGAVAGAWARVRLDHGKTDRQLHAELASVREETRRENRELREMVRDKDAACAREIRELREEYAADVCLLRERNDDCERRSRAQQKEIAALQGETRGLRDTVARVLDAMADDGK